MHLWDMVWLLGSAIEFKANNIAITVTKICVVLFFGGIYLLRGTTWITDALMGYGMVAISAIEFKANNIAITVTKICVVLFFGGIYLLRGTTWITDALMGYGMVAMVVFDVMIFSEFFAKIYYIRKSSLTSMQVLFLPISEVKSL